jgi:hypothetical protein
VIGGPFLFGFSGAHIQASEYIHGEFESQFMQPSTAAHFLMLMQAHVL